MCMDALSIKSWILIKNFSSRTICNKFKNNCTMLLPFYLIKYEKTVFTQIYWLQSKTNALYQSGMKDTTRQ